MMPESATTSPGIAAAADASPTVKRGFQVACFVVAALAAAFTAWHVAVAAVDVPFWDDFDSFLGYLLELEEADGFGRKLALAAAFHNEHRTFTSRAVVWAVHTLGGGMDFRVLALVSAGLLMPLFALVTATVQERGERAALVLFAGAFLFNLQHFENLYWGGSGCDHLGVVVLAFAALALLDRWGVVPFLAALACGVLAAFTLAQGMAVFPAGALLLLLRRRWRDAAIWLAAGAATGLCWMIGYPSGGGDPAAPGVGLLFDVPRFWLGLLGAPLAFGLRAAAPWIGAAVTLGAVLAARAGWFRARGLQLGFLAFLAGAMALIAVGRGTLDPDGFMVARYRILSGLSLALLGWFAWCGTSRWRHGTVARTTLALAAVAFVVEQGASHAWRSTAYRQRHEAAAAWFAHHGTLKGSPVALYYDVPKADRILAECARRGLHDLAALGRTVNPPATLPRPVLSGAATVQTD